MFTYSDSLIISEVKWVCYVYNDPSGFGPQINACYAGDVVLILTKILPIWAQVILPDGTIGWVFIYNLA